MVTPAGGASARRLPEQVKLFTNLRLGCLVLLTAEGSARYQVKLDNLKLAIPVDQVKYLPTVATRTIKELPITLTRRA